MRTILFHIPHEVAGLPVFGAGWMLLVWALGSAWLLWRLWWTPALRNEIWSYVPILVTIAAAILFLLPQIEDKLPSADPEVPPTVLGLPVRGYGVMLLSAVLTGVGVAARRTRQMGVDPEHILGLAFWVFLGGIAGARLTYVIQYSHQFRQESLQAWLWAVLNITQGGLVVYGALVVVIPVAILYARRARLPLLALIDVITPGMVIGLAIGRLGCFLHGCCYGGICTLPWAVAFPAGPPSAPSPPYAYEWSLGLMYGFRLEGNGQSPPTVAWVAPGSRAAAAGLTEGEQIRVINGQQVGTLSQAREVLSQTLENGLAWAPHRVRLVTAGDQQRVWEVDDFPATTPQKLHPTQLYAAVSAFLLFGLLWFYYPIRRHDGEVFALFLLLSPLSRFLEEVIRDDESSFVLGLTISQFFALLLMAGGVALWAVLLRRPPHVAWPVARREGSSEAPSRNRSPGAAK